MEGSVSGSSWQLVCVRSNITNSSSDIRGDDAAVEIIMLKMVDG